jgi:hypothetical protein
MTRRGGGFPGVARERTGPTSARRLQVRVRAGPAPAASASAALGGGLGGAGRPAWQPLAVDAC